MGGALAGAWLAAALVLAPTPGYATLYRWVDANGLVHFSDREHLGAQAFNPGAGIAAAAPSAHKQAAPPTTGSNAQQCKALHQQLRRYENATSITETDALGHSRVYTAAQTKQLVAKTRERADHACNTPAAGAGNSAPVAQ